MVSCIHFWANILASSIEKWFINSFNNMVSSLYKRDFEIGKILLRFMLLISPFHSNWIVFDIPESNHSSNKIALSNIGVCGWSKNNWMTNSFFDNVESINTWVIYWISSIEKILSFFCNASPISCNCWTFSCSCFNTHVFTSNIKNFI